MYKRNVFERIHDLSKFISDEDYFSSGNLLFEYYFEYQHWYNIKMCIMIRFIIKLLSIQRDKKLTEMDMDMEK